MPNSRSSVCCRTSCERPLKSDGHRVESAIDVDPSFNDNEVPRSALRRSLASNAVRVGASRAGVEFRTVAGGGLELRLLDEVDRRYRLRKATSLSGGELEVLCSSDSFLTREPDGSLFRVENWAFLYTIGVDGFIDRTLVAEVTGYREGSPGCLILGQLIELGNDSPLLGGRGFQPADEDLDDLLDDEDREDEGGWSTGS